MPTVVTKYSEAIINGLLTTLALSSIAWLAGILFGTILGYLSQRDRSLLRFIDKVNFFFLSVPVIVLLFWLHYPAQAILGIIVPPFLTASLLLSIIAVFAVADIVQRSLKQIDVAYIQAAVVCGLTKYQTFRYIQAPIFLQSAIPSLLRTQVAILHMTLFTSLISVDEVFRTAQRINAEIYKPVEIYTALAILWMCITIPLSLLATAIETKFHGDIRETGSH